MRWRKDIGKAQTFVRGEVEKDDNIRDNNFIKK